MYFDDIDFGLTPRTARERRQLKVAAAALTAVVVAALAIFVGVRQSAAAEHDRLVDGYYCAGASPFDRAPSGKLCGAVD